MMKLLAGLTALVFAVIILLDQPEKIEFDYPVTGSSTTSTSQQLKPLLGSTADTEHDHNACAEFSGASPNEVREEFYYLDPEECNE